MSWFGLNIKGRTVSWLEIKSIIESQYTGPLFWRDAEYVIPNDPSYILRKSPSINFEYIPNARDCDDGNRILRGWLSQKGYGNVVAMDVAVIFPGGNAHALIGFIDSNNRLIYGDARTGKFVDLPVGTIIERIII